MTKVNERCAMDFMSDALSDGRQLRVLTVVDMYPHGILPSACIRVFPYLRSICVPDMSYVL